MHVSLNKRQLIIGTLGLIHICLCGYMCVHGTAETLDGVVELPTSQASQQSDVNETHFAGRVLPEERA